jgi:hypothetical protein
MKEDTYIKREKKFLTVFISIALLCWWRLFLLEGIWGDDWAVIWQYFSSDKYFLLIIVYKDC